MPTCILAIADVTGIQSYIFASNRLRDAVGASELVARATSKWVHDALRTIGKSNSDGLKINPLTLEDADLDAELLYSGGGNAVLLFRAEGAEPTSIARRWTMTLSERVLCQAPGLGLAVAWSEPFEWKPDAVDLQGRIEALLKGKLAVVKRTREPSIPLSGLGVSAACRVTGLPAVHIDAEDDNRPVARDIQARRTSRADADQRFKELLQDFVRSDRLNFELPSDLDDLGRSYGERSYIAVVHADGNGMGQRFLECWKGKTNREAITDVRNLSASVHKAGEQALLRALSGLVTPSGDLVAPFNKREATKQYFPVRPIIYGGDDVTFVCDGRLGLELAARYLDAFEQETAQLPDGQGKATARAGVAIVKTHYPFRRAYDLSEELADSAKTQMARHGSALDWHVAMSGLLADLKGIREREYQVNKPSSTTLLLTMRPLPLQRSDGDWQSWGEFRKTLLLLMGDEWAGRRNKVKALRDALRDGEERTRQFLKLYQLDRLPGYTGFDILAAQGWLNGVCGYFDPIEMIDLFVELKEPA